MDSREAFTTLLLEVAEVQRHIRDCYNELQGYVDELARLQALIRAAGGGGSPAEIVPSPLHTERDAR